MEEKFEIFYIRHAETSNDLFENRDRCDVDLTATGKKQAELLAKRFDGMRFDAVFSSPLLRAVKTAAAVCNKLNGEPCMELLPQIVENGSTYGYFGQNVEYLSKFYGSLKLNDDLPPMCQNLDDSDNDMRAAAVVNYFLERFTYGQRILVFSHGSFGSHFIRKAAGIGECGCIFSLNNTSVSKIKYTSDGKTRLSFCNDFSHLRPLMPEYELEV